MDLLIVLARVQGVEVGDPVDAEHDGFAVQDRGESLLLATLAPPCGVRTIAVRALDKAGIAWSEAFVGGGVTAVVAAALAGLAVAPLARELWRNLGDDGVRKAAYRGG
ncbi:DNA-binding transcriptional LysR family regulator [Bradyrhizobium barranii subsp. barranii]|nr:DNA-binding transcriptional LysR family regulator [Bradyrhizobium japonicum]MCP1784218.1 DNA-binding transcriptional LysR family regulator [Bradyrhizobium japonicum]MCP1855028.1 DNA-binding transcriptional LysR family regulator [Bradyrhizobium japonicum]MCP1897931.1 DNA-binding transcriptional LysR family regulator [Bradyrhizobium japonicum]MCP1965986.1 DNA-binding transcriptional LysR family regulator [Bradyrhizobium japonicum]